MNVVKTNSVNKNSVKRKRSRKKFFRLVEFMMDATYGSGLTIEHECEAKNTYCMPCTPISKELPNVYTPESLLVDRGRQNIRDLRNRMLSKHLKGKVMRCKMCNQTFTPREVVNSTLEKLRDDLKEKHMETCERRRKGKDCEICNSEISLPLSSERLAIVAMRHAYDSPLGCNNKEKHWFWGDENVRNVLLNVRFNEHDYGHRQSCFKKDCDCRFNLPDQPCQKTEIYEDKGAKDENYVDWYRLVQGDILRVPPWKLTIKRPQGCQYMNTHNKYVTRVFCCNTNIQIGDRAHVYYTTCYCGKCTQKEDRQRADRTNHACTKRLLQIQRDIATNDLPRQELRTGFVEGLCRMLSALNASYSRLVISAPMQHRLVCSGGTRFLFSHGFGNLLVGQLQDILENNEIKVHIRTSLINGERVLWADAPGFDYLMRPWANLFNKMCIYEFTMHFKKTTKTPSQIKRCRQPSSQIDERFTTTPEQEYVSGVTEHERLSGQGFRRKWTFQQTHPAFEYCVIAELKKEVIPKIYLPEGRLPHIKELKIQLNDDRDESEEDEEEEGEENPHTNCMREEYAKMALLMFYPHRTLNDLKLNGSHWKLFFRELKLKRAGKPTTFWDYGFTVLQNMQDRQTLDTGGLKRANDEITNGTTNRAPVDESPPPKQSVDADEANETKRMNDISKYGDPEE